MDVRVLGSLEVVGDTGPIPLPRGRGRLLLAVLALRVPDMVGTEQLVDALWGETPPPTAVKGLHNLVSDLRRRLRSGRGDGRQEMLLTTGPGYQLGIDRDRVDAHRFQRLLADAAAARGEDRGRLLREALSQWRGPALVDFRYEPSVQADIARLTELRVGATEDRIEVDLAEGRHAQCVGELEALVAEHPWRERLRGQLMLALHRSGRQADALATYRSGRQAMIDELGLEPGSWLVDLERRILARDPGLVPDGPTPGAGPGDAPVGGSWLGAERKPVTVMYAALSESAPDDADPEVTRNDIARASSIVAAAIERHGGVVQGSIGGVTVSVFGVPEAHEDDAVRAARAASELLAAVDGTRIASRVGISSGEVLVGDPADAASGEAVTRAARLQQGAGTGEVLLGETTRVLLGSAAVVEPAAALVLDRRGRPTTAWRLVQLVADPSPERATRDQPLVARSRELTRMHAAIQRAARERRALRLTVVGDPGVGKSRLAAAFADGVRAPGRVLTGTCPTYGDGIIFWPLRDIVLQAVDEPTQEGIAALLGEQGGADTAAAEIAGAIGITDAGTGRDLFRAVRQFVEAVGANDPLALVIDDVHEAKPALLDLVEYLGESVTTPLLLVCLARPELLEDRPGWTEDVGHVASIRLEPLLPADSERLVLNRLGGRFVPDEVVRHVVAVAQGNPLFIEQMLAALENDGRIHLPPSVDALLAARLDRLGPAERDTLRSAAVAGMEFSRDLLGALLPGEARPFLDRYLAGLQRRELIRSLGRTPLDGAEYAFRHALVHQAAYRSTTRATRAELHERAAAWLDQERGPEGDEVVARHLERASAERRRLGMLDVRTDELARRAGELLARSGLRAYDHFDMTAAGDLLSRARALLPRDHPERYEVLRRLSQTYPTLGRLDDADDIFAEMLADPQTLGDARRGRHLRLEQLRVQVIAGPDPVTHAAIDAEVARIMSELEPAGDHVGMSQALYVLGTLLQRAGRTGDLAEVARRGLDHARRSGDRREVLGALWFPSWVVVDGPTPVPAAIEACEDLQRSSPGMHVAVMTDLARLHAMNEEFEEALELCARARRFVLERVRVRRALTILGLRTAEVASLAGDMDAAEHALRRAVQVGLDVGERDLTAQLAAALSQILCARGAVDEGDHLASLARHHAPVESVVTQARCRAAAARVLAARGDTAGAVALLESTRDTVPTGLLNLRADVLAQLGTVQVGNEADAANREAATLYERKGNQAALRRRAGVRSPAT